MDITLLFDYSKKRASGGSPRGAYDTIEGMKKNFRRMKKEVLQVHTMSSDFLRR
jgi:hypothetical protein